jgi:GTP-binding protein
LPVPVRFEEIQVAIPHVAIVGRPNVGKSSLFNWLAGRRIAIVDPTPGVTRDRLMAPVQVNGRYVEIVDTGGMGIQDVDNLTKEIESQILSAIEQASLILFVVDARAGLVPLDEQVAKRLRGAGKPILLVVNKCDHTDLEAHASEFHRLGAYPLLTISAQQHRGKDKLLGWIEKHLPKDAKPQAAAEIALKLAIVGRRNTGKSTFINCLAEAERTIVSEVPGTTRDSVDIRFEKNGKTIVAIDTAGVRRRSSVRSDIEFYSLARAERSIRRADVVLLFLDAPKNISMVDKQLAGYILENYKPAIFVINKWDLLKGDIATGEFGDYLRRVFPSLDYVPIVFITAKEGKNVQMVLDLAQNLHKQATVRVGTGDLNRVVQKALQLQSPPMRQNRRARIFYATQVATNPPTIILFTNGPELFDNTYQRYLLKMFRDHLPFRDVPIKMYLRHKNRDERPASTPDDEAGPTADRPRAKVRPRAKAVRKTKKPELWQD